MTALPASVEPGSDRVRAAGGLAVVPPEAVPPGARVVGVVVLLPAAGPTGGLRVVPEELSVEAEPVDVGEPIRLRPDLALDRAGRSVTLAGVQLPLTRREFDLLAHFGTRPGRVLTRAHLLAVVWGHADPRWAGPRTVDVHVARLRRKLGALGSCVETVRGVGYRWVP